MIEPIQVLVTYLVGLLFTFICFCVYMKKDKENNITRGDVTDVLAVSLFWFVILPYILIMDLCDKLADYLNK